MEWFKHDSNANLDDKLQNVLLDYGLEGYGLYWYCIELIVSRVSHQNITFELKHDARIIARNTGSTPQKVEEMMKRFVELGLFENNEGVITCMKVAQRLAQSATSNVAMRTFLQRVGSNKINDLDEICAKSHDAVIADKIRIDNNKDVRLEIAKEFDAFWKKYPNKKDKKKALNSWYKHRPDLTTVLNALDWQLKSDAWVRGFIPLPSTYINGARWEDEQPITLKRGLVF